MATFTQAGNELNKHEDSAVFPWAEIDNSWKADFGNFYIESGGMTVKTPPMDLSQLRGDLIIMGHGNGSKYIFRDKDTVLSVGKIAKLLKSSNLPQGYGNQVILWTCLSGVEGGAAQLLAAKLKGLGYMALSVVGCRWVTSSLRNKQFRCCPGMTADNYDPDGKSKKATLADTAVYRLGS
jgi:hypothetical protein